MTASPRVSAVVPTLNEAANLPNLLPTLVWCDEVIVIDQGSTDATREVAAEHGARVLEVEWRPVFDAYRALGAERATGDWILQLDADEMVPLSLADELQRLARRPDVDIVAMPRLNYFQGPLPAGGLWPDLQYRFFRRGAVELAPEIHSNYKLRSDRIHRLPPSPRLALHHFHYPGASRFLSKLDHYTDLELDKDDDAEPGAGAFLWTPLRVFVSRYLKHGALRYGWRGLWLSVFWSFYFFVRAVKRWERRHLPAIHREEEERKRAILEQYRR